MAVEVAYAQGWDLSLRQELTPLPRSGAEARDTSGEPYAIVYRVAGSSLPLEVQLVSWKDSYLGVWAYDEQGRRTREMDWRMLEPGRLFLRHLAQWHYPAEDTPEFAAHVPRTSEDLFPGGRGRKVVERGPLGGELHTPAEFPEENRWHDRSVFGVRGPRAVNVSHATVGDRPVTYRDAARTTAKGAAEPVAPWSPPRPKPPRYLRELFEPGTLMASDDNPSITVGEVREVWKLPLPSGRLALGEPFCAETGSRELVEGFRPGAYPVQNAMISYELEYEGSVYPTESAVAVRLLLDERPPQTWEMALAEGEDVRLLREGEVFGFDTDGATGAFADAASWETLALRYRRFLVDNDEDAAQGSDEDGIRATDAATGGGLISFLTDGDGTYPVWLGRAATGEPVCVVVQIDYLPGLRLL
jgi:hypothetical protein